MPLIQIEYNKKKYEKNIKIPFDSTFNFLDFKDNEVIVLFVKKKNYAKTLLAFHFLFFIFYLPFKGIYII